MIQNNMLAGRNTDGIFALYTSLSVLAVTQPDTEVADYNMIRCDAKGLASDTNTLSRSRLPCYGNVGMLDIQSCF